MAGYNRIIIVGNLTRDPEHKEFQGRQSVCRLGLAANRQFKNRQSGEMVQEVCYVDVDVWGPQADSCKQYLQKGRQVLVEGRLKLDTWQDNEGKNRTKHSIVADRVVFLSNAASDGVSAGNQAVNDGMGSDDSGVRSAAKDLLSSIENSKSTASRAPRQAAPAAAPVAGFKDEPPFQDDLPF